MIKITITIIIIIIKTIREWFIKEEKKKTNKNYGNFDDNDDKKHTNIISFE